MDWQKVIADEKHGGLGVGLLKAQNLALLTKWWCRLYNSEESLWKKVIMSIHNLRRKLVSYIARKSSQGVSSNIYKAINNLDTISINHNNCFILVPDLRINILFWKDIWCGNLIL